MGFFDFIKDAGKKLLGKGDDNEAIKKEIESSFEGTPVEGLEVEVKDGVVKVKGDALDSETAAKVALIAGNVEGVEKVDTSELSNVKEETLYVIQKGDTLWKIAEIYYKNGARYTEIVAANKEVIKDADKIYVGQTIVIPNFDPSKL
jgi:nucleoid-associated protein YgaU